MNNCCTYCGAFIDSNTGICPYCGQKHDLSEHKHYVYNHPIDDSINEELLDLLNDKEFDEFAKRLGKYVEEAPDEDYYDRIAQLDQCFIAYFNAIMGNVECYKNLPHDHEYRQNFTNAISLCNKVIEAVSMHSGEHVNPQFLGGYLSILVHNIIYDALNKEMDDWNRYGACDSSLTDMLCTTSTCYFAVQLVDNSKYKLYGTPFLYSQGVRALNMALNHYYYHTYYDYGYERQQKIGISDEGRKAAEEIKKEFNTKLSNLQGIIKAREMEEERKAEELEEQNRKKRFETFWANNEKLHDELVDKKRELFNDIRQLQRQLNLKDLTAESEYLGKEISARNQLILHISKSEKTYLSTIVNEKNRLKQQLNQINTTLNREKDSFNNKLRQIYQKIEEINVELTKER